MTAAALAGAALSLAAGRSLAESDRPSGLGTTGDGQLAFAQHAPKNGLGIDPDAAIYVAGADGTGIRRLTIPCTDCTEFPRWSPDGSKLAYYGYGLDKDNKSGVIVMNRDGSGKHRLCADTCDDSSPAWSPDGAQIAFRLAGGGIGVLNTDGSHLRRVPGTKPLLGAGVDAIVIDWSPDGKQFAFDGKGGRVYVVNRNGEGLRLIARDARYPRWSPDGKKLLVLKDPENELAIYAVSPGGSTRVRVFPSARHAWSVSWSPDGTRIAYTGAAFGLHILDLASGRDRQISLHGVCASPRYCVDFDWQRR